MSNSILATKVIPARAGNFMNGRGGSKISEITIHHMAGNLSVEQVGAMWQTAGRYVSSHYGINGNNIARYVAEADTAYTNSNSVANKRAVTIEVANDVIGGNWHVSDASLAALIRLVADIAKRNGLHPLVKGKSLTWHQMYSATACPGPYLISKLQYIVDEANKINSAGGNTGGATEGVQKMKVLDVFASVTQSQTGGNRMNVQGFEKPDVNSKVLTNDANKGLADGRYWVNEIIDSMGNLPGYSGARIQVGAQQMWVSILPGATELTDMSAEDAYKRFMQKGVTGYTDAELKEAVAAATAKTKEQLAAEQKARQDAEAKIKAAQAALN